MRNLMEYANNCMEMLDIIGIEYGNIVEWKVNTRAKSRWGQAKVVPGGFSINISARLLDESNDEEGLENTIIHELLHTCEGCMNHGENWKRLAAIVKYEYGYDIKRTSTAEEKGVHTKPEEIHVKKYKYLFECEGCGQRIGRMRNSDFVQNTSLYTCGRCGGKFKRIF